MSPPPTPRPLPPPCPAGEWELWYRQPEPEASELPQEWESKCNELQRMILVRCLRPDRVIFAATTYVANAIGRKFVEPPVLDLSETYGDSTPAGPLVFVLSAGVDPTDNLRKLAAEKGMSNKWVRGLGTRGFGGSPGWAGALGWGAAAPVHLTPAEHALDAVFEPDLS